MAKPKTTKYQVSKPLQIALVVAALTSFVLPNALFIRTMILQYPYNQNFSGFFGIVVEGMIFPLVLFTLTWLISPQAKALARVVEALLLTFVAESVLIYGVRFVIEQLNVFVISSNHSLYEYRFVITTIHAVLCLIYLGFLAYWRKTGRWKA